MINITKNEIDVLCAYASNNDLTFPVGEKTIDAKLDKNDLGSALIAAHDGQKVKYVCKNKGEKRADPLQIINLCNEFDKTVVLADYQNSFAARVIRSIRATAYMSCATTAKSFQNFLTRPAIVIHGDQMVLF